MITPPLTSLLLSAGAISFMSSGDAVTVNVTLAELPEYGAVTDCEPPGFSTIVVE
jgi:hypothetical protein